MAKSLPGHAVKAVIANDRGEILFLKRNPATRDADNWDLPGGLVEPGEDDITALVREIGEELGVAARIGKQLGNWSFFRPSDMQTVAVTNYAVELTNTDIILSHEHTDARWFAREDLQELPVKDSSVFQALGLSFGE